MHKNLLSRLPELLASHYYCVWPGVVLTEHNSSPIDWTASGRFILSTGPIFSSEIRVWAYGHTKHIEKPFDKLPHFHHQQPFVSVVDRFGCNLKMEIWSIRFFFALIRVALDVLLISSLI